MPDNATEEKGRHMRIEELREQPVERGDPFTFSWDGEEVTAYPGESILGALVASGIRTLRQTPGGQPRGMLCGIGLCFDCLVTVDGVPSCRACVTPAAAGLVVERNRQHEWAAEGDRS